jgi:hypothetical protein
MAAGIIYKTVTTTDGETIELAFLVDDTGSPSTWTPVSVITDGINHLVMTNEALSTSDYALPVIIHPDGQNPNGRAGAGSSSPVVLANEDKTALVDDAAFTPGTSNVNVAGFQADESSTDSVDEGDAGAARMTLDRKQIVNPQPHTAGGLSCFTSLDLDETEEDVKTSAGQLYGFHIVNRTTSVRYLRFYNATAANVTVGTTATFAGPFEIPANASDHTAMIMNFGGHGIAFDTAISASVTTGFAANDTGAPGANDCIVNIFYK